MNRVNVSGVLFLGFVGVCLYVWSILTEAENYLYAAVVVWGIVVIYISGVLLSNHARKKYIYEKYPDKSVADAILKARFWQDQTKEQLIDSLGRPLDIDTKVLKTKTKETWKYTSLGKNRYALKIELEDGTVVGWDKKA